MVIILGIEIKGNGTVNIEVNESGTGEGTVWGLA